MFYLISASYVGPNRREHSGPREKIRVQTVPGTKNTSGAECIAGWLGATNDWSESAHGEFATLEFAIAEAQKMGYAVHIDPDDRDADVETVREFRKNEDLPVVDASDWLSAIDSEIALLARNGKNTAEIRATLSLTDVDSTGDGDVFVCGIDTYIEGLRASAAAKTAAKL